jgi:hypothetical protein
MASPTANNLFKQVARVFDPTSYSQKDVQSMSAYYAGIHVFMGDPKKIGLYPNIDQFGYTVESYPGVTLFPYDALLGLIKKRPVIDFCASYNCLPKSLYNVSRVVETEEGVEERTLTQEEWYNFTKAMGVNFRRRIEKYMADEETVAVRAKAREKAPNGDIISGVQADIGDLRTKAKNDAVSQVLFWGEVKETKPQIWDKMVEHGAYHKYNSSAEIGPYEFSNSELFSMNVRATKFFADKFKDYLDYWDKKEIAEKKEKIVNIDTRQTAFEKDINEIWNSSVKAAKGQMREEGLITDEMILKAKEEKEKLLK